MEHRIVDTSVMAFKNVLDCRERVEGFEIAWSATSRTPRPWGIGGTLPESRDIPNADCLIHGSRNNEVFFRVELSGHHVVGMASENGNTLTGSAVPDANCLIIRAGKLGDVNKQTLRSSQCKGLTIQGIS